MAREEKKAHDPLTCALQRTEMTRRPDRGTSFAAESSGTAGVGSGFGTCTFCKERHSIPSCTKFKIKSLEFRRQFIRDNRLCFSCLDRGHQVRECRNRKICELCQGRHPTIMHPDDSNQASAPIQSSATTCASNNYAGSTTRKGAMVVPVYVSHWDNPAKQKVVYAMLDTQSDTSFITDETARDLGLTGGEGRPSLSTMTSTDQIVKCRQYDGLQVRGYTQIALPGLFSRRAIPVNHEHIPCADMVDDWPHLQALRHQLMPKTNCKVGLLIGYDCPRAILPTDVISDSRNPNSPFGLKTDLGWSIIGVCWSFSSH